MTIAVCAVLAVSIASFASAQLPRDNRSTPAGRYTIRVAKRLTLADAQTQVLELKVVTP